MDAYHVFPQGVLAVIPLIGGVIGGVVTRACAGCHIPVGGRVGSPIVGVEAPRIGSKLWCEISWTGALSLGKELLSIPLQELFTKTFTL